MDKRRRELRDVVISRVPQISGAPAIMAARNVSLLHVDWFRAFVGYITDEGGTAPGPINNGPLSMAINAGSEVLQGRDFEPVEQNVYDLLMKVFSGGPQIQRPYLPDPISDVGEVVIHPIKLRIAVNEEELSRTVNPKWTTVAVKANLAKNLKKDPETFVLKSIEKGTVIPDELLAGEMVAQYGGTVRLAQRSTINMPAPLIDRRVSMDGGGSMRKSSSSSRGGMSALNSVVLAVMHAVGTMRPVVKKVSEKPGLLSEYVKTAAGTNVPMGILQTIMEDQRMTLLKHFEFPKIMTTLTELFDVTELFNYTAMGALTCSKCKQKKTVNLVDPVIVLDPTSKGIGKSKLDDLFDRWVKKTKCECSKCNAVRKMSGRMAFEVLPPVLTFFVKRQRDATGGGKSNKEIGFPLELNLGKYGGAKTDLYRLSGVITFYGPVLGQKYKAYVYHETDDKWMVASESRMRQVDSSVVMSSGSSAAVLFYVHK